MNQLQLVQNLDEKVTSDAFRNQRRVFNKVVKFSELNKFHGVVYSRLVSLESAMKIELQNLRNSKLLNLEFLKLDQNSNFFEKRMKL